MKKMFCIYLMLITFTLTCVTTYAQGITLTYDGVTKKYTGNIYKLYVNNELVTSDIPPIIINDRSLVPVRAIFEKLGAEVAWDAKNKKVSVSYIGNQVELKINDDNALINGNKVKMEVPAKIINDRTMVPLRFVGEQLKMEVGWHADKGEITISSKKDSQFASLNDIKYIKGKSDQSVAIDLDRFQNYRIMRLPSPDRIVVDFTNTKLISNKQNIPINEEILKSIRCSQFEGDMARVVLDLEGQPQYQVTETKNQLLLNLQKKGPSISSGMNEVQKPIDGIIRPADNNLSVKHIDNSVYEAIVIGVKDYEGFEAFELPEPNRIVIDIPKAICLNEQKTLIIDSAMIKSVRYAAKDTSGSRLVIDTKGDLEYKLVESNGTLVAYISKNIELITFNASRSDSDRDEVTGKGNLSVSYKAQGAHETVAMFLKDYSGYNIIKQLDQNRIVVDFPNTTAAAAEQSIDVKSNHIENIRYAGVNSSSSRVIIQLKGQCQYVVAEEEQALVINVIPSVDEDVTQVDDQPVGSKESPAKSTPIITPTPTSTLTPTQTVIATAKPTATAMPTVVVTPKPTVSATATIIVTPKPTVSATATMIVTPKPTVDATVTPTNAEDNESKESIKINHNFIDGVDRITILAKDIKDYNLWKLTGPDRVIIDIPNFEAGKEQKINVSSSNISSIRSAQFEKTTARIVIDTIGQTEFESEKSDENIVLVMRKASYRNIEYSNQGDRVYFTLKGAKLTEGGEDLKRFYKGEYELEGRKYTVTFPSELADLGFGTMNINDSKVNNVKITNNAETNQTILTFNTKEQFNYEIITRESENDTTITLFKEALPKEQLVVIDPGHGGSDPGATHGGVYEKDLNLDIAKRLNALLKSKNIKTYMTREEDIYVGLYERAYIANDMKATLFVSIHNNAYYAKYKGTETLYYPIVTSSSGFNGKRFAQIAQADLVNALGTQNRGIIERPNLVVLKATKMPAILAEIAFMTNSGDLANLKSEEFRQKAAQALCDSIIKALGEV